jgi:hypothetical protein
VVIPTTELVKFKMIIHSWSFILLINQNISKSNLMLFCHIIKLKSIMKSARP